MYLYWFVLWVVGSSHGSSTQQVSADNAPRFEPPLLVFESDLFVTSDHWVTIVNPTNDAIHIRGVMTGDPQFEVENLNTKMPMPARSRRKVRIVFVPERKGKTQASIVVFWSRRGNNHEGQISLEVFGLGGENTYSIYPVNLRLARGIPLRHKIQLRNYGEKPLHVKNVRLLGDEGDIRFDWQAKEIEPGLFGTVAFIQFLDTRELGLFQARFIIETSGGDMLSIPITFNVTLDEDRGLVRARPVDFGKLTAFHECKETNLTLVHNRKEALVVTHIEVKNSDACLTVGNLPAQGLVVPPDIPVYITDLSWCACQSEDTLYDLEGLLHVYTNATILEIPYTSHVIVGSVEWQQENVYFHFDTSKDSLIYKNVLTRAIRLRNLFPVPVEVISGTVTHEDFKLLQFDSQVLQPSEKYTQTCRLALRWTSNSFRYDTELLLKTNITEIRIPLAVFDGHFTIQSSPTSNPLFKVSSLKYAKPPSYEESLAEYILKETTFWYSPENHKSTFGCKDCSHCCTLDEGEVHGVVDFGQIPKGAKVSQTVYIFNENPVPLRFEPYEEQFSGHYRLFSKVLDSSSSIFSFGEGFTMVVGLILDSKRQKAAQGEQESYVFFYAVNEFMEPQLMRIRVTWTELEGELLMHPSPVRFQPSFPATTTEKLSVVAENTYNTTLHVGSWFISDPRFIFEKKFDYIPPHSRLELGTLEFDPGITESQEDYFQVPDRDYSSYSRNEGPRTEELKLITERIKSWSQKRSQGKTRFNAFVEILFHNLGSVHLMIQGGLQLPQLTKESVHFGNVKVGQMKKSMIKIRNPFSFPIQLQLLNPVCDVFSVNTELKHATGVAGPYQTISLGPIYFEPTKGADFINHIYIRNNITGLESVMVTGTGKQGVLVFGEAELDDFDSNPNELHLPFHYEKLGIDKTDGFKVVNPQAGSDLEESFTVTNSGNQAVVLENLFLVDPGSKVEDGVHVGCANSLESDENKTHNNGMSLLSCQDLPLTINPSQQKLFRLKLHYTNQGPVVKSDLIAATSWGFFRTTVRFEVPLEVFSLLLSLRPKRNEQTTYLTLAFLIIISLFSCHYIILNAPIEGLPLPITLRNVPSQNAQQSFQMFSEPLVEPQNVKASTASSPSRPRRQSDSPKPKIKKLKKKEPPKAKVKEPPEIPKPAPVISAVEPKPEVNEEKRRPSKSKKRRTRKSKRRAEREKEREKERKLAAEKKAAAAALKVKQPVVSPPKPKPDPPKKKKTRPPAIVVEKPLPDIVETRAKADSFDRVSERESQTSTSPTLTSNQSSSGKESCGHSNDSELSTSVESNIDGYSVTNEPVEDTPVYSEHPSPVEMLSKRPIRLPKKPIKSPRRAHSEINSRYRERDHKPRDRDDPWSLAGRPMSCREPVHRHSFPASTSPSSIWNGPPADFTDHGRAPQQQQQQHQQPNSGWSPLLGFEFNRHLDFRLKNEEQPVGIRGLNSPTLESQNERLPNLPALNADPKASLGPIGPHYEPSFETSNSMSYFNNAPVNEGLYSSSIVRDVESLLDDNQEYMDADPSSGYYDNSGQPFELPMTTNNGSAFPAALGQGIFSPRTHHHDIFESSRNDDHHRSGPPPSLPFGEDHLMSTSSRSVGPGHRGVEGLMNHDNGFHGHGPTSGIFATIRDIATVTELNPDAPAFSPSGQGAKCVVPESKKANNV